MYAHPAQHRPYAPPPEQHYHRWEQQVHDASREQQQQQQQQRYAHHPQQSPPDCGGAGGQPSRPSMTRARPEWTDDDDDEDAHRQPHPSSPPQMETHRKAMGHAAPVTPSPPHRQHQRQHRYPPQPSARHAPPSPEEQRERFERHVVRQQEHELRHHHHQQQQQQQRRPSSAQRHHEQQRYPEQEQRYHHHQRQQQEQQPQHEEQPPANHSPPQQQLRHPRQGEYQSEYLAMMEHRRQQQQQQQQQQLGAAHHSNAEYRKDYSRYQHAGLRRRSDAHQEAGSSSPLAGAASSPHRVRTAMSDPGTTGVGGTNDNDQHMRRRHDDRAGYGGGGGGDERRRSAGYRVMSPHSSFIASTYVAPPALGSQYNDGGDGGGGSSAFAGRGGGEGGYPRNAAHVPHHHPSLAHHPPSGGHHPLYADYPHHQKIGHHWGGGSTDDGDESSVSVSERIRKFNVQRRPRKKNIKYAATTAAQSSSSRSKSPLYPDPDLEYLDTDEEEIDSSTDRDARYSRRVELSVSERIRRLNAPSPAIPPPVPEEDVSGDAEAREANYRAAAADAGINASMDSEGFSGGRYQHQLNSSYQSAVSGGDGSVGARASSKARAMAQRFEGAHDAQHRIGAAPRSVGKGADEERAIQTATTIGGGGGGASAVSLVVKDWEGGDRIPKIPKPRGEPKKTLVQNKEGTAFGVWEEKAKRLHELQLKQQRRRFEERRRRRARSLPPGAGRGGENRPRYVGSTSADTPPRAGEYPAASNGPPHYTSTSTSLKGGVLHRDGNDVGIWKQKSVTNVTRSVKAHDEMTSSPPQRMDYHGRNVEDPIHDGDEPSLSVNEMKRRLWDHKERLKAGVRSSKSFESANSPNRSSHSGSHAGSSGTGGLAFKSKFFHAAALATQKSGVPGSEKKEVASSSYFTDSTAEATAVITPAGRKVSLNPARNGAVTSRALGKAPSWGSGSGDQRPRTPSNNSGTTATTVTPGHVKSHQRVHFQEASSPEENDRKAIDDSLPVQNTAAVSTRPLHPPNHSRYAPSTVSSVASKGTSVAQLVSRLNSINRANPTQALEAIDSILRAESQSMAGQTAEYTEQNINASEHQALSQPQPLDSARVSPPVEPEPETHVDIVDELLGNADEDCSDDDSDSSTVSSITNPTYQSTTHHHHHSMKKARDAKQPPGHISTGSKQKGPNGPVSLSSFRPPRPSSLQNYSSGAPPADRGHHYVSPLGDRQHQYIQQTTPTPSLPRGEETHHESSVSRPELNKHLALDSGGNNRVPPTKSSYRYPVQSQNPRPGNSSAGTSGDSSKAHPVSSSYLNPNGHRTPSPNYSRDSTVQLSNKVLANETAGVGGNGNTCSPTRVEREQDETSGVNDRIRLWVDTQHQQIDPRTSHLPHIQERRNCHLSDGHSDLSEHEKEDSQPHQPSVTLQPRTTSHDESQHQEPSDTLNIRTTSQEDGIGVEAHIADSMRLSQTRKEKFRESHDESVLGKNRPISTRTQELEEREKNHDGKREMSAAAFPDASAPKEETGNATAGRDLRPRAGRGSSQHKNSSGNSVAANQVDLAKSRVKQTSNDSQRNMSSNDGQKLHERDTSGHLRGEDPRVGVSGDRAMLSQRHQEPNTQHCNTNDAPSAIHRSDPSLTRRKSLPKRVAAAFSDVDISFGGEEGARKEPESLHRAHASGGSSRESPARKSVEDKGSPGKGKGNRSKRLAEIRSKSKKTGTHTVPSPPPNRKKKPPMRSAYAMDPVLTGSHGQLTRRSGEKGEHQEAANGAANRLKNHAQLAQKFSRLVKVYEYDSD